MKIEKTEYVYGNELTANNTDNVEQFDGTTKPGVQNDGETEVKAGSTFRLDLGGFAGVEYFFAPKISLGAEIQWTIRLTTEGNGETTTEEWDATATTPAVKTTTTETAGGSSFGFDTRPNGMITLNFHF